ncbi:MAG: outer membrane beta-barrel domain-containing protein [Calothrix sp. SM1_5_4]|nr:outer membrane beta-barrel domain-containing protein [Calothrix sp. SM1_5_4]
MIQRRFLPKTKRFELTGGLFNNLNNPFFNSIGIDVRAAYYLREQYAVELIGAFATTASRQATDDLEKKRGITTDNVVTSKGFYAAAFKWNPVYGKITWLNKSIVPFDLNFNVGLGMTQTSQNESEPTVHMGTSQVFAWSKSMAFRWDLIWNMYQATTTDDSGKKETLNQNDLFLGIGMSFYFPEATYR